MNEPKQEPRERGKRRRRGRRPEGSPSPEQKGQPRDGQRRDGDRREGQRREGDRRDGDRRQDRGRPEQRPPRSRSLEALSKPRKLDLSLPATEPFTPEELREVNEHLAFLRQYKGALRLSLNATEDLMVNGAKPPTAADRGAVKYLLSKVDRNLVQRTLTRDPFKTDAAQRARLLAGVVRLDPEIAVLLWYLEALAEVADKREAAAAFALTVDRIDFTAVSPAQMASLLEVITRTFQGHDRVQALFGLLASDTFAAALERALPAISEELRSTFAPLRAAHQVVLGGARLPDDDDRKRAEVERGIAVWLNAPDKVIRSYPLPVRARLAELVVYDLDLSASGLEVPRSLLDSLPHEDAMYARLAMARAEQLLAKKDDGAAKALLSQVVQSHPNLGRAKRRLEALSWPRVGRVTIAPDEQRTGRLSRAFWLDGSSFVWAKTAPAEQAGRLALEAQLQANLALPNVVPVIAHGVGDDGTAFVALAPGGRSIEPGWLAKLSLHDALLVALEALRIVRAVAALGLELPDANLARFLLDRSGAHGLRLADLHGVKKQDPAAAAIAHGEHARRLVQQLLAPNGELRADLPAAVRTRLGGATPLPVLARILTEQAAYASDGV